MNRIRVLSPLFANQIAAGEVVERPASVVKELVENSIDAGATFITVEIENGGIDLIRVIDNGSGIPSEDCETAFLRHATSKIAAADDISHIHTLGFRGEALASIASVADVTLITRTEDAESGMQVRMDNGALLERRACAAAKGTTLEVRDLFAKTPARLKFLKNTRTEAGYIGDYISRMIMALPSIAFHYMNNGKTVYQTYGDGNLRNAVFCIYGSSVLAHLKDVFLDDGYLRITGYIGDAELARPNHLQQSIYLNERYIRSASISNAILRAYDTRLMSGRFPFAVLNLRIATTEVDVNVHPTKMEVRFADDRRVTSSVYSACVRALEVPVNQREAMPAYTDPVSVQHDLGEATALAKYTSVIKEKSAPSLPTDSLPRPMIKWSDDDIGSRRRDPVLCEPTLYHPRVPMPTQTTTDARANEIHVSGIQTSLSGIDEPSTAEALAPAAVDDGADVRKIFAQSPYRIVGAVFAGYWIVEQGDTLFLIDLHAAHERRLYERLISRDIVPVSQPLLVPEAVRLTPGSEALLDTYRQQLEEIGFLFQVDDASECLLVTSVPVVNGVPLRLEGLFEALALLDQTGSVSRKELARRALIQASCKHAVKITEHLSQEEIACLLQEYSEHGVPMTCPHGRPVMVQLSKLDLEKMFKRVV